MPIHKVEAQQLVEGHGKRAMQIAVDRVASAVRTGDDSAVAKADRTLRAVEAHLRTAERRS